MTPEELVEREQQIRRLHRKIREYRLTPQEQETLERNKYELECMIENKFSHSKSNSTYRFPGAESSQRLGVREQIDLYQLSEDHVSSTFKMNTMSYDAESKVSSKEVLPLSFAEFSSQKEKIARQSHSPQFRTFVESVSAEKRLTEAKQSKRNQNGKQTRMLTEIEAAHNHSQLEIEEAEPCAMKVPISKCTIKKKAQDEESKRLIKRPPDMRLSVKEGELRIKLKGKENDKKSDINIKPATAISKGGSSQLKKIVLGRSSDEKRPCKNKAGLFLVEKLQKITQPLTCKNRTRKFDTTRIDEEIHYLRPSGKMLSEDRLSKRSKHEATPCNNKQPRQSNSRSPNKIDFYARMFQSIKVKNNASTASSTNQSSLTPMHSSIKESISRSTCRMPINIISPLSKGYLFDRRLGLNESSECNSQSMRLIKK